MRGVRGRTANVIPHARFTAKIKSITTIGKDDLTPAEASRAVLVLNEFKGSGTLLSNPFVRKIFFPGHPLDGLKWPKLPTTQSKINFTYRPLNESQKKAVEKCLSNKEEDRHVVIVVRPANQPPFPYPISRRFPGTARDRQDHRNRRHRPEHDRGARIKYSLGHRTIERRSQERCREIGRFRFLGLQTPRFNGLLFRMVSSSSNKALIR